MTAFSCCLWWFLFGTLLGVLLSWLLGRFYGKGSGGDTPVPDGASHTHEHPALPHAGGAHVVSSAAVPAPVSSAHSAMEESSGPAPASALHQIMTPPHTSAIHRMMLTPGAPVAPHLAPTVTHESTTAGAPAHAIDVQAARAAGLTLKSPDDLTVVEGIGPKIAALLKENGVMSFRELADMSPSAIQAILDKGGANFKLAVPETWPEQAMLAAQNRWVELKALQDNLHVGVRHKD